MLLFSGLKVELLLRRGGASAWRPAAMQRGTELCCQVTRRRAVANACLLGNEEVTQVSYHSV